MRKVRYIVPNQVVFITRRVLHRAFRLRPNELTNQIIAYLLAVLLPMYDIDCFGYVFMSNHAHLGLIDKKGRLPEFLRQFFSLLARALNRLHKATDIVWDGSGPDIVYLADMDVTIDRIGYMLANPVKAGLVERGNEWPGMRSKPKDYCRPEVHTRPGVFFLNSSTKLPAEGTLALAVPPNAAHLDRGQFIHRVECAVHEHEEAARVYHSKTGQPFLGAPACRATSPFGRPGTTPEKATTRHSEVAARDDVARRELHRQLRDFRRSYRDTLVEFMAGNRAVHWPFGTWYKVHVECYPCSRPASGGTPRVPL